MKIAVDFSGSIVLDGSIGGGALTYLMNFSRMLAKVDKNNEYFLIMESGEVKKVSFIADNIRFIRMPFLSRKTVRRLLWQQIILPILLRRAGIDVLYSAVNIAPILSYCPVVLAFRIPPKVLTSGVKNPRSMLRYYLMRKSLATAKYVITVSKLASEEIVRFFSIPEQKIHIVYHGVSDTFHDVSNISISKNGINFATLEQPFILSVSNLHRHKNYLNLVKAYKILRQEHDCQHKLVIIGAVLNKDYFRELKNLVCDLDLAGDVVFIPGVSNDKLPSWYNSADVYVLPSLHETFGMTILEAMVCRTPVVTSNVSAMPEIGDKAALYFNPHNPEDIAAIIWRVISNPGLQRRMVELGKQRAANFSWENTVRKTLAVIQKAYEVSHHK